MTRADIALGASERNKVHLGTLDIRKILSPEGLIAESFPDFEWRPQQMQMACAVQRALVAGRHLVAEAGTGVGKSFAYLIPAIELIFRGAGKVLISTFTITLQEQLINKDIPFLADCLPGVFTAVLAKGRGNYLCKRRLEFALRRQRGLFEEFGSELSLIKNWAKHTDDGSLSGMPFVPKNNIWDAVKSEHGNCRRRKCSYFRDCFYWRARQRLDCADIVVANHALMFSDLVLREQSRSILPDFRFIFVDEAHNIGHVAEDHFGINFSNYTVKFLLDGLYNARTHKGLLAWKKSKRNERCAGTGTNAEKAIGMIAQIGAEARAFFKQIRDWYKDTKVETNGKCYANFIDDTISGHLKDLRLELTELSNITRDVDERFELVRSVGRCAALERDLKCFLMQNKDDYVYWVEVADGPREAIRLRSAPLNVGPDVKRCLFDKYESVILTSATLSTDDRAEKGGFVFFAGRIGLGDSDAIKLGSPFDYEKQVKVYIEKDLPEPNKAAFTRTAAEAMKKYIRQTKGRTFVLFTSYAMLEGIAGELSSWLSENNIKLLQQGGGFDRGALLKSFKAEGESVLFGTDSFWQGVDVPGKALSSVIIVRLPFAVPDQPLLAGRLEQIRAQGGNPFYEYQLPLAIIKFKQGFGRLIRGKSDKGIVVILDSRIINKSYGRRFLAAMPKCEVEIVAAKEECSF